jgi:hypothetical protein
MGSEIIACGLNQDAIDALKQKHGVIYLITVDDGSSQFNAICREPDMAALQASQKIGVESGEAKGSMVLYDNCVLHADTDIEGRILLKLEVLKAMTARMQIIKSSVKNL